jgi:hypothetical protein
MAMGTYDLVVFPILGGGSVSGTNVVPNRSVSLDLVFLAFLNPDSLPVYLDQNY